MAYGPSDLMGDLIALVEKRWASVRDVEHVGVALELSDCRQQVLLYQELKRLIRLLPVELSPKEVEWLMELAESDPSAEVTIDLDAQTVTYRDEFEARFEIDGFTKWRLLNGYDDIGLTLRHEDAISAFEETRPAHRPRL